MTEVKSIKLIFENTESMIIDRKHLGIILISNITHSINRVYSNNIEKYKNAEEIFIQISSECDTDDTPFERVLHSNDIVSLEVNYEDGTHEEIYVNWGGESDEDNTYQSSEINVYTGDMYIVISPKEKVSDYFMDELLDSDKSFWESIE